MTQNMVKHVNAEVLKLQIQSEIQQKKEYKLEASNYLPDVKADTIEDKIRAEYTYLIPDSVIDDVAPNAAIIL